MNGSEPRRELVSIVIPTYRRPDAVRAAVQSALDQSWRAVEVIVVADGRDSATRAALADLDERVRYMELSHNQGPAAARNAGVQASRAQWIAFLDDDDLMLPGKIEAQMRLADPNEPTRLISCRSVYRRGTREDVWPVRPIRPGEDVAAYLLRRPSILGRPGVISLQTLLVHRSVLAAVPFRSHPDHEDWAWLLEAWHLAGARVEFAWKPLLVYNIDTDAASRSRRTNWSESLQWAEQYRHWISDPAFCSFLATKVALKAKRAQDWSGLCSIARKVVANKPGLLELAFLAGVMMLPGRLLQTAWKQSLYARRSCSDGGNWNTETAEGRRSPYCGASGPIRTGPCRAKVSRLPAPD